MTTEHPEPGYQTPVLFGTRNQQAASIPMPCSAEPPNDLSATSPEPATGGAITLSTSEPLAGPAAAAFAGTPQSTATDPAPQHEALPLACHPPASSEHAEPGPRQAAPDPVFGPKPLEPQPASPAAATGNASVRRDDASRRVPPAADSVLESPQIEAAPAAAPASCTSVSPEGALPAEPGLPQPIAGPASASNLPLELQPASPATAVTADASAPREHAPSAEPHLPPTAHSALESPQIEADPAPNPHPAWRPRQNLPCPPSLPVVRRPRQALAPSCRRPGQSRHRHVLRRR